MKYKLILHFTDGTSIVRNYETQESINFSYNHLMQRPHSLNRWKFIRKIFFGVTFYSFGTEEETGPGRITLAIDHLIFISTKIED